MANYFSVLAGIIPWTEEPGGLQSMGSQRVTKDCVTEHTHTGVIHGVCHGHRKDSPLTHSSSLRSMSDVF